MHRLLQLSILSVLLFSFAPSLLAQNPCDDLEATNYAFSNVDIQVGAEFEADPINCTKILTASKGQKYALILLKEYYYEDSTLAGYCNVPGDPGACISSVEVSLSGGASAASISSTATATSKSGGNWTEEEIAPGVSL